MQESTNGFSVREQHLLWLEQLRAAMQKKLPGVQSLLDEFCEVFEGIGAFAGTCKIHLKEDPKPMVQPPKQVSFTLQARFKEELDRLESPEFIESDQANTMEAKEIEVNTDASQHGLGGQLIADRATVACLSCSLSKAALLANGKRNTCTNISLQRIPPVFIWEKDLHHHRPLKTIVEKPIQKAPPRLQHLMLAVQLYNIKLKYRAGKTTPVVDALSCLHLSDIDMELQEDREVLVCLVLQTVPIASQRLVQICLEIMKDEVLSSLIQIIKVGWPSNQKDLNTGLKSFWNYCQELAKHDRLVIKGE
ncbi:hypothetical protein QYM36_010530 [Artemia franciscana]|uniref:Reverse transcriptase/retrotransposon-derived protein RNase H-like domain-containing protein n=1 Tax=Artemia franciscana TaxID=6661 RepID=A0AA88I0S4_ARTSF|nr:hypothetical protein QYM36_010530 [Artemia franciscana]